jgi:hypothetical protein
VNDTHANSNVGSALEFYARFSGELNLLADHEGRDAFRRSYFKHLSAAAFSTLLKRTDGVWEAINAEAGQLVQRFTQEVTSTAFVGAAQAIKEPTSVRIKTDPNWSCKFKIHRKGARKSARAPVWIGMFIDSSPTRVYASSWIWVNRVDRAAILATITDNVPGFTILEEYAGLSERGTLYLSCEGLDGGARKGHSTDAVISNLLAPLKAISSKAWLELLKMGMTERRRA